MKKLNFLKAIVDFVWIMAMITIPIILFLSGFIVFSNEPFDEKVILVFLQSLQTLYPDCVPQEQGRLLADLFYLGDEKAGQMAC